MLPRIQPIAPKRIQAPFDHTEFVFELKMDGWRCLTYIENGACRLISRKQNQLKACFMRATWRGKASGCLRRSASKTAKGSSASTKEAPTRLSLSHG